MAKARPRRSASRGAPKCPACGHRADMHAHRLHNSCIICARTGGRCKVMVPPELMLPGL